ncbi:MAG TPA: hydrogenase maturation nickel metallochaperone HypA [Dongiaceae bacterium]|jgi:hydrogenase nickel incorporation protein HypA/HybF|nr:hydrogenase maturation nickel metallochaperone HypA [Dongiaceae bacterium]
MHELGITRNIVAIVAEHAKGRPVRRVRLEIGRLSGVMSGAVRFCFEAVARETPLEGAVLEIVEPEGRARCRACGADFAQDTLFAACGCGARDFERLTGEELKIVEFEIETGPEDAAIAESSAA